MNNELGVWTVHHLQQSYSWDCGVTSVMMILNDEQRDFLGRNLKIIAKEEGFGSSTWTIDLSFLLQRFGIKHQYCTTTLGVDPGYVQEGFYKAVLNKDSRRVQDKFSNASGLGIQVEKRSVSQEEIISHLNNGLPIIALVNGNLLLCDKCSHRKIPFKFSLYQLCPCVIKYTGHYIVLVAYDSSKNCFLYQNPSQKKDHCEISPERFDKARKSYGTDEDLLFIYS